MIYSPIIRLILPIANVHVNAYWYDGTYLQCQGCETISYRSDYDDSWQTGEEDLGGAVDHEELYPRRVAGRNKLEKVHLLPPKVERIYSETHEALCGKVRVLAGVGVRALLKPYAKKKAKGKDLRERIDKLVDIGILTKAGADICMA